MWRLRAAPFAGIACALFPILLIYIAIRSGGRRPIAGAWRKLSGLLPRSPAPPLPRSPAPLLVHGVSLGEVSLMRPLVPKLEAAFGRPCLLTTTTETGMQGLEKHFPGHPREFLPFDLPWAVERFLSSTRPAAVVLLEAEFWPVLLCACFRRGIPVALVNARVSPRSFARFRHLRALVSPLFAAYAGAVAQNGTYAARLRALGCRVAVPTGSMKADMVALADAAAIDAEGARTGLRRGEPVLLLASTSDGEERAVLDAWKTTGWRIIICPRHPERGEAIARELGRPSVRTSTGGRLGGAEEVLIVDEIGRLGALYGWCSREGGIAVVGGSLGSRRGGQNMLEAAAARCATVVGWDVRSQPDSMHLLRACGGVVEVRPETIAAELAALAADADRRTAIGDAGHGAWLAGQGATDRVVRRLVAALATARN